MTQLRIAEAPLRRDLATPALRAFFNITDRWGLGNEQERVLLGNPGRSTFFRWKGAGDGAIGADVLERISYILGIYKALHILYGDELADEWPSLPNSNAIFAGTTPLAYMLSGGLLAMQTVRRLLDARRGGL